MHYAITLGDGLNHKLPKYKCNESSSNYWQCCILPLVQKNSPSVSDNNLVNHCST